MEDQNSEKFDRSKSKRAATELCHEASWLWYRRTRNKPRLHPNYGEVTGVGYKQGKDLMIIYRKKVH